MHANSIHELMPHLSMPFSPVQRNACTQAVSAVISQIAAELIRQTAVQCHAYQGGGIALGLPGLRACGSKKGTPGIRTCPCQSVRAMHFLCSTIPMYVRGVLDQVMIYPSPLLRLEGPSNVELPLLFFIHLVRGTLSCFFKAKTVNCVCY